MMIGDIIHPDDYARTHSAWVAPSGTMLFVQECGHLELAVMILGNDVMNPVDQLEQKGYIHLSYNRALSNNRPATEAQRYTLYLWSMATGYNVPKEYKYNPVAQNTTSYSDPYAVYTYGKTYQNRGD